MRRMSISAVLLLVVSSARAQSESGVALKGGFDATTLAEDNRVDRYGFSGGIGGYLQWPLSERYSLAGQMDLLYTPRGARAVFEGDYIGETRQHYFDVDVMARPEVKLGPASIYLLLGGGLNILLSASKEDGAGKQDITDGLHRIDVALLVGAGVALHLPREEMGPLRLGTIFLEARHDHGLIDTDVTGGYKNRTSSLMLGLSFVLSSETTTKSVSPPAQGDTVALGAALRQ